MRRRDCRRGANLAFYACARRSADDLRATTEVRQEPVSLPANEDSVTQRCSLSLATIHSHVLMALTGPIGHWAIGEGTRPLPHVVRRGDGAFTRDQARAAAKAEVMSDVDGFLPMAL